MLEIIINNLLNKIIILKKKKHAKCILNKNYYLVALKTSTTNQNTKNKNIKTKNNPHS